MTKYFSQLYLSLEPQERQDDLFMMDLRIYKPLLEYLKHEDIADSKFTPQNFEKQLNQFFELLEKRGWRIAKTKQQQRNIQSRNPSDELDDTKANYIQVKAFTLTNSESSNHDLNISEIIFEYSLQEEILNICFNLSNDFFLPKNERYDRLTIENVDSFVMILTYFNDKTKSFNFYIEKESALSQPEEENQAEIMFKASILYYPGMNITRSVVPLIDEGMMIKNVFNQEDVWDRDFQDPLAFSKETWRQIKEKRAELRSSDLYLELMESVNASCF